MIIESQKRRIRVLTLIEQIGLHGGAEHVAFDISRNLDKTKFESVVCATRSMKAQKDESALVDELNRANVHYFHLNRRSKTDVLAWKRLSAFLRSNKVDIIHSHMFGSNFWAAVWKTIFNIPVFIAHEHAPSLSVDLITRQLDRQLIGRKADLIIAASHIGRQRLVEIEGVPTEKVVTVPNAIPSLPEPTNNLRGELGIAADVPTIVAVGVFRRQKRFDLLIDAVAKIRISFPTLKVLIAGGDEGNKHTEREFIIGLIEKYDLRDNIILLGRRPDINDVLAAGDVCVCCSDFESSPLTVLEYMDAAKPIVSTPVGSIPFLLAQGISGLFFECNDSSGLAEAVTWCLNHPTDAKKIGLNAQKQRRQYFRLDSMVRKIESIYERQFNEVQRESGSVNLG